MVVLRFILEINCDHHVFFGTSILRPLLKIQPMVTTQTAIQISPGFVFFYTKIVRMKHTGF